MNERLMEIETRMAQLRGMLAGGEGDLTAIEAEVNELTRERSTIMKRMEMIDRLNGGAANPMQGLHDGTQAGAEGRGFNVDAAEYRGAWAAMRHGRAMTEQEQRAYDAVDLQYRDVWALEMLGRPLNEEQRRLFDGVNAEYRAFAHDTENTAVLIPNTVVGNIWKRAEEAYPLWGDVRKFHIRGTLTAKRHTGIEEGDADWYDEDSETADEKNAFGELTLSGCELSKSVTVKWKLRSMAVRDFIAFIEREIADRIGAALGRAAFEGKGKPGEGDSFKPQPRGVKTFLTASAKNQVVTYAGGALTEATLRAAMAKLHSSYVKDANVYCNNATAWTVLAGIQDANKRPIFINNASAEGAVGRVFGMPVRVDASLADGEILFGDAHSGYWANINEDMTMHMQDHVKKRETDYAAFSVVDGDVFDEKAFALVMPEAAASAAAED